jgi:hypothetical protein
MPSWFEFSAALAFFREFLPSLALSAFLPRLPAGSLRPPVPIEDYTAYTLHLRRVVHVLLTCLAYGDRRRAHKHRANGGAPALRQPPALETLQPHDHLTACAAVAKGTFPDLLADDLIVLVRLARAPGKPARSRRRTPTSGKRH